MKGLFTIPLVLLLVVVCSGQTRTAASGQRGRSCVDPEAIGYVTRAYYRAISGPPGSRNWDQFRASFLQTARFDSMGIDEKGKNQFFPQSLDEYIDHLGEYLVKFGFYQTEVKRATECYARIAHVLSTYESRNEIRGKVIDRGVMSFQMIYDEGRWKVAHVMWNSETREHPLPARFLR